MRRLATLAAARLREADVVGIDPTDVLQLARQSVVAVMRGYGGQGAWERLNSARTVLSREYLPQLTDEQLLFEFKRRCAAHDARATASAT